MSAIAREATLLSKFSIIGLLASGVHMLVALVLVSVPSVTPYAANLAGFVSAWLVSFSGQSRWTFRSSGALLPTVAKFATASLVGLLASNVVLNRLLAIGTISPRIALFIAVVLFACLSYLLNRLWVFRTPAPRRPPA